MVAVAPFLVPAPVVAGRGCMPFRRCGADTLLPAVRTVAAPGLCRPLAAVRYDAAPRTAVVLAAVTVDDATADFLLRSGRVGVTPLPKLRTVAVGDNVLSREPDTLAAAEA